MSKKLCPECGERKSVEEFFNDGHSHYCRICHGKVIARGHKHSPNNNPGFVYLVQDKKGGEVKIGFSVNPTERIKQIRREWVDGESLQLIATKPVPNGLHERFVQERFSAYRTDYEWFKPVLALYQLIHEEDGWIIHHDLIPEFLF